MLRETVRPARVDRQVALVVTRHHPIFGVNPLRCLFGIHGHCVLGRRNHEGIELVNATRAHAEEDSEILTKSVMVGGKGNQGIKSQMNYSNSLLLCAVI